MAGTVRGTFDLNSRPASSSLRKLRTEGDKTERTFRKVGEALDRVGTPKQVRRVDIYKRKIEQLERAGRRSFRTLRKEWTATDRQVTKSVALQSKEIDHLQTKLEELALMKATPEVDVDGVAEALAQVELLHSRLRALGRERVTPRIGVGATAARAAATQAAASGAGAFGGAGGTGLRSLNLGPLSMSPKAWPVLLGLGLPAATNIGGAAVGLGGSLGAGALGAGAIGIAGGGVLTTAIGAIASVAVPTASRLKEAGDALQAFQDEVRKSGRNSVEAREKWREFNRVLGDAPGGTRRFLRTRERLGRRFGRMTAPAREDLVGIMTDPLQAANRLTPQFSGISNRFFARGGEASDRFFGEFATGGRSRRFLRSTGMEATESLDEIEAITEHILGSLMNITVASRPFFREALDFLEEWTGGWLDSTDNIGQTRNDVREMVTHLRAWLRLGGATFKLIKDLMSAGSGPGRGLVFELTDQLNEWDRWVKRNPREVRSFFRETVTSTKKLAGALGSVAESLFEISQMLTPLLDQFSGLVSFLGSAGMLSPGGLPFLLGAGAGIRNARRGASARILGGRGPGMGGELAMGAAATGAFAGVGGGYSRAGGIRGFFRGGPRVFGPTPMISTPYGPMPNMASTIGQGSRGFAAMDKMFGGAGRFARGFGSRFLPFAALSGGLGALSFEGNAAGRLQAGASSATMGAIPFPKTEQEKLDAAQQSVAALTGGLSPGELGRRGTRRVTEKLRSAAFSGGDFMIGTAAAGDEEAIKFGQRLVKKELRAWTSTLAQQEGTRAAADFYRAFRSRSKDKGAEAALKDTVRPALEKLKELGPRGGRIFAQNTLKWAREAKRKNPALRDEYDELADKIERRFRRMGRSIEVIHGRIYTDSDSSWRRIKEVIGTQSYAAEREASGAFGELETEVFRRLRGFGYSQAEARNLMYEADKGHPSKAGANAQREAHRHGMPAPPTATGAGLTNARGGRNRFAGGGRFAGRGTYDNVALPGGGLAAPGEFWIGNRHTERRLNTMLAPYGTSVGNEIEGESMKHSSTPLGGQAFAASLGRRFGGFARGGRGRNFATGGIMAAARLAQQLGLAVGEGPGFGGVPSGGHAAGSLHYQGLAYDVSGSAAAMRRYFFSALRSFRGSINELFYDPIGWYIDQGQKVGGSIGGHSDHVHIGFNPGGAMGSIRGMGGAMGRQALNLKRRRARQGGVPGALAQRGMDAVRLGLERKVNRRMGVRGGGGRGEMMERFMGDLQRYNHVYPSHGLGEPGTRFSPGIVRKIAESAGLPGLLFEQIAHGESGYYPGIYGVDPGGTVGRGLWAITSGVGNDAMIAKYGGPQAMFNPMINARAAKEIYDSSGIGAWYGTKYVTDAARSMANARGGRNRFSRGGLPRWGGSFRRGGDFTTRPGRPVQFEAGEGLEQEEVSVRPKKRPGGTAGRGGDGGGVRRVEAHLHFHGPVHVRSEADLEAIKAAVADGLLDALRETDSVRETEVTG